MRLAALTLLTLLVSGCATTGTLYKDAKQDYKPVAKDTSRLFIYREASPFGAALQPGVYLDGIQIGDAVPGAFIKRDIAAGQHKLVVTTEVEKSYSFTTTAKEERFFRLSPGIGWLVGRIHIEPVSAEIGANEISELHEQTSFKPDNSSGYPKSK